MTHDEMSVEEYRKYPALNFSLAKHLLDSPAHFKVAQDEEFEPTEAMMLGTITHALVLEGRDTLSDYVLKPDGMSFATKDGKAWKEAQTKPIIAEKKALKIPYAAKAISENSYAKKLLELCPNRETYFIVEYRGVKIKALIDCHGDGIISDFKTAADAGENAFGNAIFDRHYDMQAVWYQTVIALVKGLESPPAWYWLACELSEPFRNEIYLQSERNYANGLAKMDYCIDQYKKCIDANEWKLPANPPREIETKPWQNFNYIAQ